jgi:[ribosomal protein S18]-alanine N-acetyltransferase
MLREFSENDIEIREMREDDLDDVLIIERRSFLSPWSKRLFKETIDFPLSVNLVVRKNVDKSMVGYANFYLIGNEVQVLNIAIAPELRKKGFASTLLSTAIKVLAAQKAKEFFLEVRESNDDAIRLYEKLGFVRVGKRRKYYTETNEDAIVMRLGINNEPDS